MRIKINQGAFSQTNINEIWYIADNKTNEKLSKWSELVSSINMSSCAIASRLDTSTIALYNYLINLIYYNEYFRELIHYGAD